MRQPRPHPVSFTDPLVWRLRHCVAVWLRGLDDMQHLYVVRHRQLSCRKLFSHYCPLLHNHWAIFDLT